MLRRGHPTRRERPRTWGIWFVIASLTGSAIIGIVRPFTESWTSLQIWSAIFLLTPVGIALDTVPRLIRPRGWTSAGATVSRTVPLVLLATSVLAFGAAMLAIDGRVALLGIEARIMLGLLAFVVVLGFAARVPLLAFGGIGLLYAVFSVLVQFAWIPVVSGHPGVEAGSLLATHIAGALALIVGTAVVQVFRHGGSSAAESAITDWLRSEAILPEKPATERAAS
jgi:hypothetical protein